MAASVVAPGRWVRAARAITMSTRNLAPVFSKENDYMTRGMIMIVVCMRLGVGAPALARQTCPGTDQQPSRMCRGNSQKLATGTMQTPWLLGSPRMAFGRCRTNISRPGILAETVNVAPPERPLVRSIARIGQVSVRTTRDCNIPQIRLRADLAFVRRRPTFQPCRLRLRPACLPVSRGRRRPTGSHTSAAMQRDNDGHPDR